MKSLQEEYAPWHVCFGCGPSNAKGLQIRSFPRDDGTVEMTFEPREEHQAYPNVVAGGILGTLLDCHSSWAAAWHLGERGKDGFLPCTVTAAYTVKLVKPAPLTTLHIVATVKAAMIGRAVVTATVEAAGEVVTTSDGTFVSVDESVHPSFARWDGPRR